MKKVRCEICKEERNDLSGITGFSPAKRCGPCMRVSYAVKPPCMSVNRMAERLIS